MATKSPSKVHFEVNRSFWKKHKEHPLKCSQNWRLASRGCLLSADCHMWLGAESLTSDWLNGNFFARSTENKFSGRRLVIPKFIVSFWKLPWVDGIRRVVFFCGLRECRVSAADKTLFSVMWCMNLSEQPYRRARQTGFGFKYTTRMLPQKMANCGVCKTIITVIPASYVLAKFRWFRNVMPNPFHVCQCRNHFLNSTFPSNAILKSTFATNAILNSTFPTNARRVIKVVPFNSNFTYG